MKVIQYGCGKMAKYTIKYAIDKGYDVVGAVDVNESVIGTYIENVLVSDVKNIEELIKETNPDIVLVTTMSLLSDCKDALMICAKNGVNALTICEEAFYPFNSNPKLADEIDKLAKENNCTITGTGYQDAFWGNLVTTLAGASHNITKIKGTSSYNVEDYGIALAKAHGAGLSKEDFDKEVASADNISVEEREKLIQAGEFLPSYMWNVNGWLCDKLGLTVLSQTQECIPTFCDEDINSSTLDMVISKGNATGMRAIVKTETKEGISFETECVGKVYSKEDYDSNKWTVEGDCNTTLAIDRPDTVKLTCATMINRIIDVVNSESGFIPTSQMNELKYTK